MSKVHNIRVAHIQHKRYVSVGATGLRLGMTIDGPVYQEIFEGKPSIHWSPLWFVDDGVEGLFFPYGVGQNLHQTRTKWGC